MVALLLKRKQFQKYLVLPEMESDQNSTAICKHQPLNLANSKTTGNKFTLPLLGHRWQLLKQPPAIWR